MTRRVLITGITGFAGSHLAERLVAAGASVHGVALDGASHPNLRAVADAIEVRHADVTSLDDMRAALAAAHPDVVVHLAGQAVPAQAARDPVSAVRVNVLGTATVLAALEGSSASLVLASSADVYGTPQRSPVSEDAAVHPENPYAATKVAAEALAHEAGERGERAVVILRATNQIGPRQHPGLAASAFAKQIAEAEAEAGAGARTPGRGVTAVVRHGSLDARRDFLDVRDMAEAYALAADMRAPGAHVFNVGTGRAVSVADVLAMLVELARTKIRTELDPARVRRGAPELALDASRFRGATGWEPKIELKESLADLLDYWRERVTASAARPANV